MHRLTTLIAALMLISAPVLAEPDFWVQEWPNTNFDNTSIKSWAEIQSGGPPRDGIPAIDAPQFRSAASENGLQANEEQPTTKPELHVAS